MKSSREIKRARRDLGFAFRDRPRASINYRGVIPLEIKRPWKLSQWENCEEL